MTLYSFALFLLPVLIGFFCVHLLWQDSKALLLKFALGIGVGMGLASLLYFVFLIFFAGKSGFFIILLVILFALAVASFKTLRFTFSIPRFSWIQITLLVVLLTVTLLAAGTFVSVTLRRPHGGFDAWLIWNRASRFIYRGGADWKTSFSSSFYFFFHADYPLMLPLTNAWAWDVLKSETLRVPFIQGALYLFGTALLLFSGVHLARGLSQASLACVLFLGTVTVLTIGSAQMADIPLAMLILSVVILFYLSFKTDNIKLFALTGFVTGLCGWMKNEGDVFILFATLALALMVAKEENKKQKALWYFAGLAFPLLVILYFKLTLALGNDLAQSPAQAFQKMTDLSRYAVIGNFMLGELKSFGGWNYLIPLLVLYYFIARDKSDSARWRLPLFIMLILQVLSYIAVYIITPMLLEFHLSTSFDRILLHVYPSFLFVLFASTILPEKIFSSPQINPL